MVGLFVYEPVRGHFVYMGHRNMQDHESHTSTPKQSGKARWRAPVLRHPVGIHSPDAPSLVHAAPKSVAPISPAMVQFQSLDAIIESAWKWHEKFPRGYED